MRQGVEKQEASPPFCHSPRPFASVLREFCITSVPFHELREVVVRIATSQDRRTFDGANQKK